MYPTTHPVFNTHLNTSTSISFYIHMPCHTSDDWPYHPKPHFNPPLTPSTISLSPFHPLLTPPTISLIPLLSPLTPFWHPLLLPVNPPPPPPPHFFFFSFFFKFLLTLPPPGVLSIGHAGLSEKGAVYQEPHRGHGLGPGHSHGQGLDDDSYVTGTIDDAPCDDTAHDDNTQPENNTPLW